jgi:uncharacterized membrane protein
MPDFVVTILAVIWGLCTIVAFCYGAHTGSLDSPRSPFLAGLIQGITFAIFWPIILLGLVVLLPQYAWKIKKDDPTKDQPPSN